MPAARLGKYPCEEGGESPKIFTYALPVSRHDAAAAPGSDLGAANASVPRNPPAPHDGAPGADPARNGAEPRDRGRHLRPGAGGRHDGRFRPRPGAHDEDGARGFAPRPRRNRRRGRRRRPSRRGTRPRQGRRQRAARLRQGHPPRHRERRRRLSLRRRPGLPALHQGGPGAAAVHVRLAHADRLPPAAPARPARRLGSLPRGQANRRDDHRRTERRRLPDGLARRPRRPDGLPEGAHRARPARRPDLRPARHRRA